MVSGASVTERCHGLCLGVDGGASHSSIVVTDCRGTILAQRSNVESANPHVSSLKASIHVVAALIRSVRDTLLRESFPELQITQRCRIVVALSGGDSDEQCETYRSYLHDELSKEPRFYDVLRVVHDAVAPLAFLLPNCASENHETREEMACLIAGTGSVAIRAQFDNGKFRVLKRCGGWGHLISDEGSAFSIAVSVLRTCTKIVDSCGFSISPLVPLDGNGLVEEATAILCRSFDHFSLETKSVADLAAFLSNPSTTKTQIASFSKCIGQLAREGNLICRRELLSAGERLGKLVADVVSPHRLAKTEYKPSLNQMNESSSFSEPGKQVTVCCIGGVFGSWDCGVRQGMLPVLQRVQASIQIAILAEDCDVALASARLAALTAQCRTSTNCSWSNSTYRYKEVITI